MIREETRARARAIQMLYACETGAGAGPEGGGLPEAAAKVADLTGSKPEVTRKAEAVVQGILAEQAELDREIAEAAEHWRLERVGSVERCILRLAVYELRHESAPPRVIIDEALWLAHRFAGPRSPAFINGVLDRVARALGRL